MSKLNNVIFLMKYPFDNERDIKRFGIELLQKNGFNVEVYDLFKIFYNKEIKTDFINNLNYYKKFYNKKNVIDEIKKLPSSNTFIFNFVDYYPKSYWLFKIISLCNIKYSVFIPNDPFKSKKNILKKLKKFYNIPVKNELIRLSNKIFYKIPLSLIKIKPANLILAYDNRCKNNKKYPINETSEIVLVHSMDYDVYLNERNKISTNKNIAVFLDEYYPFHPEYKIRNDIDSPFTAEYYYPLLNKFFDFVEKNTVLEVVIASHPRSNYDKYNYFEDRTHIKNKTANLVKNCQLVLGHASTSFSYANLFYKPVIFITMKKLDNRVENERIKSKANLFGKKPIYVDNNISIDWNKEMMINVDKYDYYRQRFIKNDLSDDIPFWQIVSNKLKTI